MIIWILLAGIGGVTITANNTPQGSPLPSTVAGLVALALVAQVVYEVIDRARTHKERMHGVPEKGHPVRDALLRADNDRDDEDPDEVPTRPATATAPGSVAVGRDSTGSITTSYPSRDNPRA